MKALKYAPTEDIITKTHLVEAAKALEEGKKPFASAPEVGGLLAASIESEIEALVRAGLPLGLSQAIGTSMWLKAAAAFDAARLGIWEHLLPQS